MLDGVVAREVLMSDNVSVELLGAGDLLQERTARRPGPAAALPRPVDGRRARAVAVLDARFARTAAAYPEVTACW